MSELRPVWNFECMSEAEFRRMYQHGMIVSVKAKRRLLGLDTSEEWLEAENFDGKKIKVPHNYRSAFDFVGYSTVPGLFDLTYRGKLMRDKLKEIDDWEKKNKLDREEYRRLKIKFKGDKLK